VDLSATDYMLAQATFARYAGYFLTALSGYDAALSPQGTRQPSMWDGSKTKGAQRSRTGWLHGVTACPGLA
jgi:hypothetical protein